MREVPEELSVEEVNGLGASGVVDAFVSVEPDSEAAVCEVVAAVEPSYAYTFNDGYGWYVGGWIAYWVIMLLTGVLTFVVFCREPTGVPAWVLDVSKALLLLWDSYLLLGLWVYGYYISYASD